MNWYAAHYAGDPAAGNVFGRENLRLRRDPMLEGWLAQGGGLGDFLMLDSLGELGMRAQHEEMEKRVATPGH